MELALILETAFVLRRFSRREFLADPIVFVEPPAQVDHLAPLAAERSIRQFFRPLDRDLLAAGWATE
jgi:hypothetical protein